MKNYILLVFITIITFISCNKDDDSTVNKDDDGPGEEMNDPTLYASFEITLEPSFKSAIVSWGNEDLEEIDNSYSIFINEQLYASNLTRTFDTIISLDFDSEYLVEVVAENVDTTYAEQLVFRTLNPDNYTSFISKFVYPNPNHNEPGNFYYNNNNKLDGYYRYKYSDSYSYDQEGNLTQQKTRCCLFQHITTDLTYEDNKLAGVAITHNYEASYKIMYEFQISSLDSYTVSKTVEENDGTPINVNNNSILLVHDAEERIVNYKRTNIETQEEIVILFEYENGNLVKITDVTNSLTVDIVYDTMNNYRNYNHYHSSITSNYLFFGYDNNFISDELIYMPEFTFFNNKNNPKQYLENDVSVKRFQYSYNELGYPISVRNPNNSALIYDLEYILLEND